MNSDINGFSAHYGHWGLVLIMIVLVSWILYRFVAPRSWREWVGAGLVQAFSFRSSYLSVLGMG